VTSLTAALRGDAVASFDHELWVWFFAGIARQRWRDRRGDAPNGSLGALDARTDNVLEG
jgi:hypothetical protein